MGLRDQILAVDDAAVEVVAVPEWTPIAAVRIKALSGTERDAYEASMIVVEGETRKVDMANARAKLLVQCIVDENGDRVFQDSDALALGKRNAKVLDRLVEVARRLSGLESKAVEVTIKN